MKQPSDFLKAAKEFTTIIAKLTQEADIISSLLDFIHLNIGFSGALGGLYRDDRHTLYSLDLRGDLRDADPLDGRKEMFIGPHAQKIRQVIGQGNCLFLNHEEELPSSSDRLLLQQFSRKPGSMMMICPIQIAQRTVGLLAVESTSKWRVKDNMIFIHALALQAGLAIDRLRVCIELETAEREWKDCVHERIRELQTANDNLQELNRLKNKFVAIVSHELRTPLTAIHMLVDNLLEGITGRLETKQKQYCTRIAGNVQRLQRLTADLLDLARIESGQMKLSMTGVAFPLLVEDVVADLRPVAEAKQVNVWIQPAPNLPTVWGDRDRLFQVLNNLVHNAIKFSEDGGEVTITFHATGHHEVELCIADTGCGMAPREIENIFLPFYCIPSTQSFKEGVGLGLALTRELVTLHHGTIQVESQIGQGSRFHLLLPTNSSFSHLTHYKRNLSVAN